jgi:hypothetical protein
VQPPPDKQEQLKIKERALLLADVGLFLATVEAMTNRHIYTILENILLSSF